MSKGYSVAHDDQFATDPIGGDDYDLALREAGGGIALIPGHSTVALCDHTFELQSMRNTIEALRAENEFLKEYQRKCVEIVAEESAKIIAEMRRLCAPMSPAVITPPYIPTCGPLPGERE